MEWPKIYPKSCPPRDAKAKSVAVYRFLHDKNAAEIKPEDFITVRQKDPNRKFRPPEKECRACSLSILTDRQEVIRMQKRVPRFRVPAAAGRLTETSGKIKHTPSNGKPDSSHHSWWVPIDIKPWLLFHEIIKLTKSA